MVGEGPALAAMKTRYPDVHFLGKREGCALAKAYATADVFVFPSRTDTFGLVILEALASGVPVAAYPVPGPIDVLAGTDAGALDEDLQVAALKALTLPRTRCREHALRFTWSACARPVPRAALSGALTPRLDEEHGFFRPQRQHEFAVHRDGRECRAFVAARDQPMKRRWDAQFRRDLAQGCVE